jgi:hypothetical protein
MRIHWRSLAGILATAALLSLFWLLPSGAEEAKPAAPPPAAAAAPAPASEAPEERAAEEPLPADERMSADNNLSFPVDI